VIEVARLSYTPVTSYMDMTITDFVTFREALTNVLDRENAARREK